MDNVNHLSAEELLGYLFVKGNLTPIEQALMRHLAEALDKLKALG